MKTLRFLALLAVTFGLLQTVPAAAAAKASPPTASAPAKAAMATAAETVVENFYTHLTAVMKKGPQLGFAGRYKALAPAIRATFDLPLMTRFAVGPVWFKATPDQQQQLVSAFSDFSVATYASRFTTYDGEKFTVLDQKPAAGGGVIVETKLIPKGDAPVALNYLMKPDAKGQWRIVDVFLDGSISELATRRAEFTSIVDRDGIKALVTKLGEKSKEMGPS